MTERHEWMTDGISLDASDRILGEYEGEGWELVSLSWDSSTGTFMGAWKRPVAKTAEQSQVVPDSESVYESVGRLRAWIRDFGDQKQPEFIADLKTVLDFI